MKKTMLRIKFIPKFILKTIFSPKGTTFEHDHKPVNRFEYAYYGVKLMMRI